MFLVFDTETTGLPPLVQKGKGYEPIEYTEKWNDCRLVQIAWMVCTDDGTIISTKDFIIRPKYFIIPEESTKIHGITQEIAKKNGVKIEYVLQEFLQDVNTVELLVAHNIHFDYHVVLSELYRLSMECNHYKSMNKYCTMRNGSTPNEKWWKLSELYQRYFQEKHPLPLHRALNDVEICKDIYMYQRTRKI